MLCQAPPLPAGLRWPAPGAIFLLLAVTLLMTMPGATPALARPAIPQAGEVLAEPLPPRRLQPELPSAPQRIAWQQAPQYVGDHVMVEGRIAWAHNHRDQIWFLNFTDGRDGPFYVAVFRSAFWLLGPDADPNALYRGRTLRFTGTITRHRGRPCLNIRSLNQITVDQP